MTLLRALVLAFCLQQGHVAAESKIMGPEEARFAPGWDSEEAPIESNLYGRFVLGPDGALWAAIAETKGVLLYRRGAKGVWAVEERPYVPARAGRRDFGWATLVFGKDRRPRILAVSRDGRLAYFWKEGTSWRTSWIEGGAYGQSPALFVHGLEVHVIFAGTRSPTLWHAVAADARPSDWKVNAVDKARLSISFESASMDARGRIHAAYIASHGDPRSPDETRHAVWSGASWKVTTIPSPPDFLAGPRIVVGPRNAVGVLWTSTILHFLRLAAAGDLARPQSLGFGGGAALEVDSAGNVWLGYHRSDSGELGVGIRRGAKPWTFTSAGNIGKGQPQGLQLVLDRKNRPHLFVRHERHSGGGVRHVFVRDAAILQKAARGQ